MSLKNVVAQPSDRYARPNSELDKIKPIIKSYCIILDLIIIPYWFSWGCWLIFKWDFMIWITIFLSIILILSLFDSIRRVKKILDI